MARVEILKLAGLASVAFFMGVCAGAVSGKGLGLLLIGTNGVQAALIVLYFLLEFLAQRRNLDQYAPPRNFGSAPLPQDRVSSGARRARG
jgi:hypothetical protein